jgi:hypothetical protein
MPFRIWLAPARYSADLFDVFEKDPLVEAAGLVPAPRQELSP